MKPTEREVQSARRLADAVLELLLAHEEGAEQRRAERERQKSRRLEQPGMSDRPPIPPGLLTQHDAAEYLSVSVGTLFNRTVPRGPIPVVRIGAAVRYRLADLEAFAASRAEASARKAPCSLLAAPQMV